MSVSQCRRRRFLRPRDRIRRAPRLQLGVEWRRHVRVLSVLGQWVLRRTTHNYTALHGPPHGTTQLYTDLRSSIRPRSSTSHPPSAPLQPDQRCSVAP
ncbi:hypothetical protein GN956_G13408 [Arapaima gigas]